MNGPSLPQRSEFQPGDLVTIDEARQIVCRSRRSIYNWIAQGKLDVVYTPSGRTLIIRRSLVGVTREKA